MRIIHEDYAWNSLEKNENIEEMDIFISQNHLIFSIEYGLTSCRQHDFIKEGIHMFIHTHTLFVFSFQI